MEKILKTTKSNFEKVKEKLLKDDQVSRISINFREGSIVGENDTYFVYLQGPEETVKRAVDLVKDLTEELPEEKEKEVLQKLKEEENQAIEGFGNLF